MTSVTARLLDVPSRLTRRLASDRAHRQLVQDVSDLLRTRTVGDTATASGPRVGFATFGSGCWHLGLEVLLAQALALRGARSELLICDLPDLPICDERTIHSRDTERCAGCVADKRALLNAGAIPWQGTSAFVSAGAVERARALAGAVAAADLEAFVSRGWPVGRWLHVSACHYLRCDARGEAAEMIDTRRRLLASAIVTVEAVEGWLDAVRPDVVIAESGAHFMWRIARELARARDIPVVCREMGKGGWDHHIYALNADAMSPDLNQAWSSSKLEPLSAEEDAAVDAFLGVLPEKTYRRRTPVARATASALRTRLGIPEGRRVAVAFTNVTWDLATAGRDVAFTGVFDWLRDTIHAMAVEPLAHLIVRAHPAEASVETRERILDQVRQAWPGGLPGVTLIEPEADVTAPDLVELSDLALVYNSTAGIEAAIGSRPVLLCGDPHYRGKGFTVDITSRAEYQRAITDWAAGGPIAVAADAADLARRYVHLFFLRYHVAMGWTSSPLEPPYRLVVRSIDELQPGSNPALDLVCDGILRGQQIVRPRASAAEVGTWPS